MECAIESNTLQENYVQQHCYYLVYLSDFMRVIVGCAMYDSFVAKLKISEFVGVSDEALALLIWENQEERWMDMVANGTSKSTKQGMYTDGGTSRNQSGRSRKGKGWSNKGIIRFNDLCKKVEENRKTQARKDLEDAFLAKKQEEASSGSGRKRKANLLTYANDEEEMVTKVYMELSGNVACV